MSSAGHEWRGRRSSWADGAVYVRPPHSAVQTQHQDAWRGARHGALVLLRSHDGVRCALRHYKWQCLYLTTRFPLRAGIQPPSCPACVIKTGTGALLTNPRPSLCNQSLLQLLVASASKPPPKYVIL